MQLPQPLSITKTILTLLFLSLSLQVYSQTSPQRFEKEVEHIITNTPVPITDSPIYLFTGSSSIRLWKDLNEYFPEQTIINTGFGGSQTHELLYYSDQLIFRYKPYKIFIYEGDNDLADNKSPLTVLKTMKKLVAKIRTVLPDTEIILLSPKPSLSRWHLKESYESFNRLLKIYSDKTPKVAFINLWDSMLDDNEKPLKDIFKEDQLHLNKKGYDLWAEEIKAHIP